MILFKLNYLPIVVSALIYLGVAALWYSPILFGRTWMAENGVRESDLKRRGMLPGFLFAVLASLVLALGLALLLHMADIANWFTGALLGGFLALLISAPAALPIYVFENRSMKLFFLNEGMPVAALLVMGAVIAGWQ